MTTLIFSPKSDRNQSSTETVQAEKDGLSRTRSNLQSQIESLNGECEKLRNKLSDLQAAKDASDEEREELVALQKRRDEDEKRTQRNIELLEARGFYIFIFINKS